MSSSIKFQSSREIQISNKVILTLDHASLIRDGDLGIGNSLVAHGG
jgi:hypothetical protein